ncbi:hypothetical protein GCK32_009833, partial [Trichostrongylus colubriformis]
LQAHGRPDTPGKPHVQQKTADSVVLTWTEPKKDGGSPIQQFLIEMCTAANKKWKKAETAKQATTTLFNLVPGELYIFRVKAANKLGDSEFSEESEPFSLKEPPVDEDKQKIGDEKVAELIDYEKVDSKIDPSQQKVIDVRRLPNDLLDKYIICEELGQGAYGTVYRAIEKATGKTWAAKMVQVRPGVKKEDVLHEISIMNQLHHNKLLNLHEVFDLGSEMCLIEEFVSGGELLDKIIEDDMLMSEEEAKGYMYQILQGLEHMHQNQIVHLDLKPENILLKSKTSTDIKIIDFGLSRKLDPKKTVKLLFGTPEFCAPEVVNYEPVSFSTDMWSVGVITYVLLSGLSPFLGDTDEETLANVAAADWGFDDPVFDDVSDAAKDFICRLMCKDKRRRMTVKQALQHPWISKASKAPKVRGQLTPKQKKKFMQLRRWSDDLLPIGRLAKRGAIFRQQSMDGVFERQISFDADHPPHVKKQLEDIVAYVGDLIAELSCEMDASPLPQITWFKGDKELDVPSIKYDSQFEDGVAGLTVKNIEQSDSGVYRCRATNELGSASTEARLIVEVRETKSSPPELQKKKPKMIDETPEVVESKPSFNPGLVDKSIMLGENLTLSVTCVSASEVTVDWFHNDELINESDVRCSLNHVKNQYELLIDSVSLKDEDVRCHFESSFSENIELETGKDIELCCTVSDQDGVVVWYKDGKMLHESDRIVISAEGTKRTLRIRSSNGTDSGTYRCETSDGRSTTEAELVVKEQEPLISIGPQDVKVEKLGIDAKLRCELTSPAPKVLWYKNGQEIWPQADKYAIITSGNSSVLEIRNVDKHDVGEYTAALNEKEISAPARLELEVAPEILIRENLEDEIVSKAHDELAFHIEVIGYPTPTVAILHKDSRIQNRASVEEYDNIVSVRMKNLSREDCGTVKITAENEIGAAHKEICLTVLDVPSEPLGLTASQTTAESTVLLWNNPEKTNGAPITGFIIERKAVDSNRWRPVGKTTADTTRFKAAELFSGLVYSFRVIAVNSVGEGPPSQSIDVFTAGIGELGSSEESSPLETPTAPQATFDGAKILLSWSAVPDAIAYQIERQCDGGEWQQIAPVDGTSFVDLPSAQGGSLSYRVTAKGSTAESNPSESSAPLLINSAAEQVNDRKKLVEKRKGKGSLDRSESELVDDRPLESPKSIAKKTLNPVDDIVNTKQRLKKRKPVENERRSSIPPGADDVVPPSPSQIPRTKAERAMGEAEVDKGGLYVGGTDGKPSSNGEVASTTGTATTGGADIRAGVAETSKNVNTSFNDGVAQLKITCVEPSHGGTYSLNVSNVCGAETANIMLVVKSVPSTPEGPLVVSISGKSCKLSWSSPLEDGHSEILGYCIEKYDEKTKKWMFQARCADNLYTLDIPPSSSHRFRVSAENAVGRGPPIESGKVRAHTETALLMEKPTVMASGGSIIAAWKPLPDDDVGYIVEIKEVNSRRSWKTLNPEPVLGDSYTITGLNPGSEYIVRVTAVSSESRGAPSEESEVIKCEDIRGSLLEIAF